jgi:hypothetical protein
MAFKNEAVVEMLLDLTRERQVGKANELAFAAIKADKLTKSEFDLFVLEVVMVSRTLTLETL